MRQMGKYTAIKSHYRLLPQFEMRELGGEFIAIEKGEQEADPSRVVFMNERCIFLWGKLEDGASLKQMVEALMDKFDLDEEDAEGDVGEFIGKLKHAGMAE